MTKFTLSSVPEFVSNFQLVVSSFLVQSNGSLGAHRCYRASIVQEVGNLPSVARLRASNEVRYVCCSSARRRHRVVAPERRLLLSIGFTNRPPPRQNDGAVAAKPRNGS